MTRCAHCFGELTQFVVFCPHCSQAHETDLSQLISQTVGGRYRLYRQLGQGGLSTVFAATDLLMDRVLVVKVSDPSQFVRRELTYAIDAEAARRYWAEMLERMRREAETLVDVDHPNIVKFYETGLIGDDLRYVVMEFLRGRTLREVLNAKGRLELSEAMRVALDICAALEEIHYRGIIHRDINPSNVMIAESMSATLDYESDEETRLAIRHPQSAIKLIDFGIAKFPQPPGAPPFTQHSVLSGTVSYASPEQCQSRAVDHRSDIYSLGVMLYEVLTGERPFTGRTPTEIALKHIQLDPVPPRQHNPEIPVTLEKAILRALAKSPDERQQSISELSEALSRSTRQIVIPLQSDQAVESGVISMFESDASEADGSEEIVIDRARLVRRRRRRVAFAAAAIIVAMIAAGAMLGQNWFGSHLGQLLTGNSASNVQSSGSIQGGQNGLSSDADYLEELASQLPYGAITPRPTPPQTDHNNSPRSASVVSPIIRPAGASPKLAAKTVIPAFPKPAPVPASQSVKSQKQTAQVPATTPPPISPSSPVNQPVSQPSEVAQAKRNTEEGAAMRRENDSSIDQPNRNSGNVVTPPSASRDRIASNRSRSEGDDNHRRYPDVRSQEPDNNPDDDEPYREEPRQIGPKLIQWSGSVNREREIIIELPGVPGTLEIPRVYRNRVGMVEPPSASNRWRCAKLRVFGKGGVSIVVRWWPSSSQYSRLAGQ